MPLPRTPTDSSDYTMTDLATLLTQLYQHGHSMENIVKAIYIPDNITIRPGTPTIRNTWTRPWNT
jgi:hypothetical protein